MYLSMIRDLYDRSIVAYKTSDSQTVSLVLDTIHLAMKSVKTESRRELHLHSDQGFQYTSQAYFDLTKEYGILPSMSRRGNCYDNALAENFFGISLFLRRSLCMVFLPLSSGVFRLSLAGSSPGIPCRRSFGFQGSMKACRKPITIK